MKSQKNNIFKNRMIVSDLIFDVVQNKKSVKEAVLLFPKDKNDMNIKCAFDALMHREADEEFRKKIKDYALIQDRYLVDIAKILKQNQKLPANILRQYIKYYPDDIIGENPFTFKNLIKSIKRMVNF